MKKSLLIILSVLIFSLGTNIVIAKPTNPETSAAIKLYKAGDYTKSYLTFSNIVKKDPSNALAYYYLGMSSVQLGKKDEAVDNYNKAIELSPNGILGKYAKEGLRCAENAFNCHEPEKNDATEDAPEDKFIKGVFGTGFSQQARGAYEKQKIENMKREINRRDDIPMQKFKEYKDFSSQATPTDEEIISALRTLQKAGLENVIGTQNSDLSFLLGTRENRNDVFNSLFNLNEGSSQRISPELIQSLLTTQLSTNF